MEKFNRELELIKENQMVIFRTKKVQHLKLRMYKICLKAD